MFVSRKKRPGRRGRDWGNFSDVDELVPDGANSWDQDGRNGCKIETANSGCHGKGAAIEGM
jgi:hypothetical protein